MASSIQQIHSRPSEMSQQRYDRLCSLPRLLWVIPEDCTINQRKSLTLTIFAYYSFFLGQRLYEVSPLSGLCSESCLITKERTSPAIAEVADCTALEIMIGKNYYNIFVRRSQFMLLS